MTNTQALLSESSAAAGRVDTCMAMETHTHGGIQGREGRLPGGVGGAGKLCEEVVSKLCTKDVPGPSC